jgi:type II secretory pathway component HofQ
MKLSSFKKFIPVDDPETGEVRDIAVRVKRMSVAEASRFRRDYTRSSNPLSNAFLARLPDGPEQEKKTVIVKEATDSEPAVTRESFVIDESTIQNRRFLEMTPAERARYDEMDEAEERFSENFISETCRKYIRVVEGQNLEAVDDFDDPNAAPVAVRTGEDLINLFGGRQDLQRLMLRLVHMENEQDEPRKKVLRPLFGLGRSLGEHKTDQAGKIPAPTVESAENAVSAEPEDAPNPQPIPSGSAE